MRRVLMDDKAWVFRTMPNAAIPHTSTHTNGTILSSGPTRPPDAQDASAPPTIHSTNTTKPGVRRRAQEPSNRTPRLDVISRPRRRPNSEHPREQHYGNPTGRGRPPRLVQPPNHRATLIAGDVRSESRPARWEVGLTRMPMPAWAGQRDEPSVEIRPAPPRQSPHLPHSPPRPQERGGYPHPASRGGTMPECTSPCSEQRRTASAAGQWRGSHSERAAREKAACQPHARERTRIQPEGHDLRMAAATWEACRS